MLIVLVAAEVGVTHAPAPNNTSVVCMQQDGTCGLTRQIEGTILF